MDSPPLLWSLLDPRGASATWREGRFVDADPTPAGAVTTTICDVEGVRVTHRDGLVQIGGGVALVRLVRTDGGSRPSTPMTHELRLGGFDGPWAQWVDGTIGEHRMHIVGGHSMLEGDRLITEVHASSDRWTGFAVVIDGDGSPDLDELVHALDGAQQASARAARRARLPTRHRQRVLDALAVIDACTYRTTGAVIASPTTSLPEAPGGDRQFDYRYSWMRDAAMAVSLSALMGRRQVAERYLAYATRHVRDGDSPCPCPVVAVDGSAVPDEREIVGVAGWAGSTPVRVGNAARDQVQFDAWGLLCEAVLVLLRSGGTLHAETWAMVRELADVVVHEPRRPSNGIWELRKERDVVAADIGRWLVLDRALRIARRHRPWTRRRAWRRERDAIKQRVLDHVRPDGACSQSYDDVEVRHDASSLMAVIYGLIPRRDPRARQLVLRTIGALEAGPYLHRYEPDADDGFRGAEGAFLPASWWAVEALAVIGDIDAAERRADDLCARSPRLISEEADPATDTMLGNTPLVWAHAQLAHALYTIDTARLRRRVGPIGLAIWHAVRDMRLMSTVVDGAVDGKATAHPRWTRS